MALTLLSRQDRSSHMPRREDEVMLPLTVTIRALRQPVLRDGEARSVAGALMRNRGLERCTVDRALVPTMVLMRRLMRGPGPPPRLSLGHPRRDYSRLRRHLGPPGCNVSGGNFNFMIPTVPARAAQRIRMLSGIGPAVSSMRGRDRANSATLLRMPPTFPSPTV